MQTSVKSLSGNISYFSCSWTPPRLHLTVTFFQRICCYLKHAGGGQRRDEARGSRGKGESWRSKQTEREKKGVARMKGCRSALALCQEFNWVTYIQTGDSERVRVWMDRFVLFPNRNPSGWVWQKPKRVWICGHHWVRTSLEVSPTPAGHLSGPRWWLRWRPWLYSLFRLFPLPAMYCASLSVPVNKIKWTVNNGKTTVNNFCVLRSWFRVPLAASSIFSVFRRCSHICCFNDVGRGAIMACYHPKVGLRWWWREP